MEKEEKLRYTFLAFLSALIVSNSTIYLDYHYAKGLAIDANFGSGKPVMDLITLVILVLLGLVLLLIALDFLLGGVVPDIIITLLTWIYVLILGVLVVVFAFLNYLEL